MCICVALDVNFLKFYTGVHRHLFIYFNFFFFLNFVGQCEMGRFVSEQVGVYEFESEEKNRIGLIQKQRALQKFCSLVWTGI